MFPAGLSTDFRRGDPVVFIIFYDLFQAIFVYIAYLIAAFFEPDGVANVTGIHQPAFSDTSGAQRVT